MVVKVNFETGHFFFFFLKKDRKKYRKFFWIPFDLYILDSNTNWKKEEKHERIERVKEMEIVKEMMANKGMLLNFLYAFHLHSIPFHSIPRRRVNLEDGMSKCTEYVLEIQLHAAPTPKNDVLSLALFQRKLLPY